MNHAIDLAVGCRYFLPGLRLPPQRSPDGATCKRQHTSDSSLLLIYRPRKDERLSWPSWLTCPGWFTHISGHPSAAGRAQDRENSPVRDRRSTTVLRHQPGPLSSTWACIVFYLPLGPRITVNKRRYMQKMNECKCIHCNKCKYIK